MSALDYRRIYRAHVEAPRGGCEVTVYVEAFSRALAIEQITAAIAAGWPLRTCVDESIYNCTSAADCIDQGESEDLELRLFEVGWGGGRGPLVCRNPIFLVDNPGAWASKWAAARAAQLAERGEPSDG